MDESVSIVTTWMAQPFSAQLLELVLIAGILGFVLVSVYFFIKAVRPNVETKDGTKISFFAKRKKALQPVASAEALNRPSLLNHRFFRMMRSTQTAGFFQIEDSTDRTAKGAINLAFLRDCKFKVFREGIEKFVSDVECLPTVAQRESMVQQMLAKISELVNTYEEMAKSLRIMLPNDTVIYGVPRLYMVKFNKWHGDHTAMCLNSINDVLCDKLYEDWYATLRASLDYLYVVFDLTMQDAKLTLKDLNGDLDKEIEEILSKTTH